MSDPCTPQLLYEMLIVPAAIIVPLLGHINQIELLLYATVSVVLDLVVRCTFPPRIIQVSTFNYVPVDTEPGLGGTGGRAVSELFSLLSALEYIFLVAGLLGDVILIHRCYRLWNSRIYVIIIPLLGTVAPLVDLVREISEQQEFKASGFIEAPVNSAIDSVFNLYTLTTFIQNLILTGMIAGRMWWLNYKTEKILGGQSSQKMSPNLLGPILESGSLTTVFLLIWVVLNYGPVTLGTQWRDVIGPCTLTQVMGIASTLIAVRIGLGVDALSSTQPHHPLAEDAENQHASDLAIDDHDEISEQNEDIRPREPEVQPFQLKYDQPIEDLPSMTYHTPATGSDIQKLVQPGQRKYVTGKQNQNSLLQAGFGRGLRMGK
ncbi:hypothetical protein BT96DRAFT_1026043 [Gymnopus androsaceus JB14]|uniref:Uncharacterized protein n=1 Tax=Gymnopus androsaceus JB14 TaxID=1447944 RepID=A0A6A4GNR0_9AGAR|nr:hypothetical protein BT96DRAFT_1026043 [Gymnopus androsaceus JB14]